MEYAVYKIIRRLFHSERVRLYELLGVEDQKPGTVPSHKLASAVFISWGEASRMLTIYRQRALAALEWYLYAIDNADQFGLDSTDVRFWQ